MIVIARDDDMRFHVWVDGQEIDRLKSFSVSVSNEMKSGACEAPSYCVEQYIGRASGGGFQDHLPDQLRDDGKGDIHDGAESAL